MQRTRIQTPRRSPRTMGPLLPLLILVLLLAGCGPAQPAGQTAPANTPPAAPGPTEQTPAQELASPPPMAQTPAAQTPAAQNTATLVAADSFQNPVLEVDFPDPDVIRAGDRFYAYATNGAGKNIQVARSSDLIHWDLLKDALPALPVWAQLGGSLVWAPGVIGIGNRYLMYYTARDTASNKQCVGVATSDKPEGIFMDDSQKPLVCQPDEGGSIDPQPFLDGGKLYLYWKNDGNCCGIKTYLYVQELSADGLSLRGTPKRLTQTEQSWQGNLIEAPFMVKHDGRYYLFFSANDYASANYAVGYALCQSATGPCQQAQDNPILQSRLKPPLVIGPGGESVLELKNGQTWMFYHVWNVVNGTRGDSRYMWLDRLDWQNGKPVVNGPTTAAQPAPTVGGWPVGRDGASR